MGKLNFLTGALVSAGVLTLSGMAYAQDATAPQAAAPAQATPDASAPADKLGTVFVTANKRLQSDSKVSSSLAVVTAVDLKDKGVTNAAALTEQMPNVQIGGGNFNSMEIVIRGIGSSLNSEVGNPEAAFHIDGIYIGRSQGATAAFFDLDRVEVLRGPQGTLYGRNANAGAINLVSKKPSDRLEGEVDAEIGNYNARKVDAMVNVPVSDALSLRAVVSSSTHDGYTKATVLPTGQVTYGDDQDSLSARISALLKFSPSANWLLTADTSKNSGVGPEAFLLVNGQPPAERAMSLLQPSHVHDNGSGLTSTLNINLGAVDFTYLYGHRVSNGDDGTSIASVGLFYDRASKFTQDSHELRLSSAGTGPLQWVGGLYYYKEHGSVEEPLYLAGQASDLGLPAALNPLLAAPAASCAPLPACLMLKDFSQNPVINESKAVFGQATYSLTSDWRAILGARFNRDEASRVGVDGAFTDKLGASQPGINNASVSSSKATFKIGVEHDLTPTQMVYASLATGYKAGGFNDGNQISPTTPGYNANLYFKPEEITSLEAGVKGRFLDGKLRLGASAFYYDYKDLQVASVINLQLETNNAAKATVKGLEFEGAAITSPDGRVNFGLGYLDSTYKQYLTAGGTDYSGHTLDRAPKVTLTLGYTQDWELEGGKLFSAYLGTRYSSSYGLTDPGTSVSSPGSPAYAARTFTQKATTKTDFVLTYAGNNDRWKVQAFVKNIENKASMTSLTTVGGLSSEYVYLSDPRTYGLRASYKF